MKILLFNRAIGIFGKDKTSQLKSEEMVSYFNYK